MGQKSWGVRTDPNRTDRRLLTMVRVWGEGGILPMGFPIMQQRPAECKGLKSSKKTALSKYMRDLNKAGPVLI